MTKTIILFILILMMASNAHGQTSLGTDLVRVVFSFDPNGDGFYQVREVIYDTREHWNKSFIGKMRIELQQILADTTFVSEADVVVNFRFSTGKSGVVDIGILNRLSRTYGDSTVVLENGLMWENDESIWIIINK